MDYKYKAIQQGKVWIVRRTHYENLCAFDEYFTGYGYAGEPGWCDSILHSSVVEMDRERAETIVSELTVAGTKKEIVLGGPELSFEISECDAPLEAVIELVEREYPGFTFDRTENRYQSCIMAIFTKD